MADASSTSPNKETVTLRLPSGEMVDAVVPAGFSDEDLKSYVRMKQPDLFGPPTSAASMPGGPSTQPKMQQVGLLTGKSSMSTRFGEELERTPNPGVSEGAGLRGGLAEYVKQGPISVGQGAADLARGNLARGGHEVLSGAMNTTTPALPFMVPAAPAAFARGAIGGAAGGALGQKGAEFFGANPDQAALAGDIGGIVGGGLAAKAPDIWRSASPKVQALATVAGKHAVSQIPGAGMLVRRPSLLDYVKAARTKPTPEPPGVYPGAPNPTATPEQLNPALISPSRTLPGMNPPEVTGRPTPGPIQGPSRGLALPAPDLMNYARGQASSVPPDVEIPASKVSTTPPKSSGISKADTLARMRSIAQQPGTGVTAPESSGPPLRIAGQDVPADTNLAPALQKSLPQSAIQGKVMQVLRTEEPNATIGRDKLINAPQLRGIDPDLVEKAVISLGKQGKIWHEPTGGGAHEASYTVALKKR